jgi:hypothetical protein
MRINSRDEKAKASRILDILKQRRRERLQK